jgi:hypothetical protein
MIPFPTQYQWLQSGQLIVPFGYTSLGNVVVATYAFDEGDDERLIAFSNMIQGRLLRC